MKSNQLSDYTDEEYQDLIKVRKDNFSFQSSSSAINLNNEFKPIDWRNFKAVTPVKDITKLMGINKSNTCAASYATAAIDTIESAFIIENKKEMLFSEQQILDCSSDVDIMKNLEFYDEKVNYGCGGGYLGLAFRYAMS